MDLEAAPRCYSAPARSLACCNFRLAIVPKLGFLAFFVDAFLGCIRCVPFLAGDLEGALSFLVTLATFAVTSVRSTCDFLTVCLLDLDGHN